MRGPDDPAREYGDIHRSYPQAPDVSRETESARWSSRPTTGATNSGYVPRGGRASTLRPFPTDAQPVDNFGLRGVATCYATIPSASASATLVTENPPNLPDFVNWPSFPFTGDLRLKPLLPRASKEPP